MYIIDRQSDTPLYIQIRESIIKAVETGKLSTGDRLPPVAQLSSEIGVTQATVRRALQDLGEAGYTTCHVGRGTFICDPEEHEKERSSASSRSQPHPFQSGRHAMTDDTAVEFATRRLRSSVRQALVDIVALAQKPDIIHLTRGVPDPAHLPESFLDKIAADTLATGSLRFTQASEESGFYELRQEIARRFNQGGGAIGPDQVLVTNGCSQAVTLIAQSAMQKRPKVICETPCYQGMTDTFSINGHWVESVPRDAQGPDMEKLHHLSGDHPSLLYLCSYVHNPTGLDLSHDRAAELISWAEKTGSTIIADEIFKDLRYDNSPAPSLLNRLGSEQTIVVSSLSKSVMTGLRLGWIISSSERIRELAQLKRVMDYSTPSLIQGMALTLLSSKRYDSHIDSMRELYQQKMTTLQNCLQKYMPKSVSWSKPTGGYSAMIELPRGYSSVALLLSAIDRGVSFLPGPLFDIDQRYVHTLRLSTAGSNDMEIKEGVELLAAVTEDFLARQPADLGLSGMGSFQ